MRSLVQIQVGPPDRHLTSVETSPVSTSSPAQPLPRHPTARANAEARLQAHLPERGEGSNPGGPTRPPPHLRRDLPGLDVVPGTTASQAPDGSRQRRGTTPGASPRTRRRFTSRWAHQTATSPPSRPPRVASRMPREAQRPTITRRRPHRFSSSLPLLRVPPPSGRGNKRPRHGFDQDLAEHGYHNL